MTDRGAVNFGATRDKPAWFANLSAGLRPALRIRHHVPSGFGQVITPLVTGDAKQASEMYAGRFAFGGQIVNAAPSDVFTQRSLKPEWRDAMANLSWLAHFNASNRGLHDQYAMRLLHYWCKSNPAEKNIAIQAIILIALTTHGQMIAQRCETSVQSHYFEIIAQELHALLKLRARNPEQSLSKSVALLYCSNGFQGLEHLHELADELIERNLDREFLPDGGHVTRDRQKLIAFLELVVPLQLVKTPIMPTLLSNAVENGLALLNLLQGPDGNPTGLLQDDPDVVRLRGLFEAKLIKIPKLNFAPHSGFARVDHNKGALIAETSTKLGLDFFDGKQKLMQTQSLEKGLARPADLQTSPQGTVLMMQSANQNRTCFLSADGHDLRIEDEFNANAESEIIIHIAQGIRLSSLMDRQAVMLVTPDQSVWNLKQRGGTIQIRQSNMQSEILIHLNEYANEGRINWSLKKQAKAVKSQRKKASFETDLLI